MSDDLTKLSTEDLLRMYQAKPEPAAAAAAAAPASDLSAMSTEDLLRVYQAPRQAEKPSAALDVAKTILPGLARGLAGTIGLPNAAVGLMDRFMAAPAARVIGKALGVTPANAPFFPSDSPIADGFPSQEQILKPVEAVTGPLYKPQTVPGELANTLAEFAPNALFGGGSAAQRVGQVVVPALASEGLGQATRQLLPEAEPAARLVGAVAGGIGAGVAQAPRGGNVVMREAMDGITDEHLTAAQTLRENARSLPGGGMEIPLDEALNHVTGGKAGRLSQISRVVANSGGEGGRIMGDVYAARPDQIRSVGEAALDAIAPPNLAPSALGLDVQTAARAGVRQTPEGMAFTQAREAVGPRVTDDAAGQVIQPEMRRVADSREAARRAQADQDYAAARAAPEKVGVEGTVRVERPGEPIVTQPQFSRPQFEADAPRPVEAFERPAGASPDGGPESLARFIARNGGLRLDGDAAATDLHRFNIPGVGNVARPDGKSLDNFWRERLIEEGYFRPDPDGGMARDISSELLRKLQNEQRGVPSYPLDAQGRPRGRAPGGAAADEYAAARSTAETRLAEDLTRVGIDPVGVHPDIRDRAVGALMRGEIAEPLDAYEQVVSRMKGPLEPYVKSTTVTEEIPSVRFGQVNPQSALDAIDAQLRTAKGDVRGALAQARKDLFGPGGETDLSVEGLLHARERLDTAIRTARDLGDATKVRDLQIARSTLDGELKGVPEVATADANFAANSRPVEPFEGDTPLARVVRQDPNTGRMATPTEQVPAHLQGASATREFLANATPAARQAYEGRVATRILDGATDARGNVDSNRLSEALRDQADVLAQMPEVYRRLEHVVRTRDGLARVEKSPLGQVAATDDAKRAVAAIFPHDPFGSNHVEIGSAMSALARNNPTAARDLARIHLETAFNAATRDVRGTASQYGGAGFASAVRGNDQQAKNLQASIRALPEGDTIWAGLDRFFATLEATGYKPQKGSDTAFNIEIRKSLANGTGPLASAITEAAGNAAAGGVAAGAGGAAAGGLLGLKKAGSEALLKHRIAGNSEQIARMLTDPAALPDLRALARSREGTKNAQLFTTRLLALADRGRTSGNLPERKVP
ncbi:hypothetical protein [Methylobacterium gossipiicola]|uniref:Uncharacterized protein n=1 Tax=Methylobacterium gossipiicola TaxID=582675 RepID=A0A1I2TIZ8_9HYPH|nr:hypothetical protein [Methylobacterium gossipiicola]SFG64884.1 hypothetical protein SAMN05192565_107144 [Methylobacterium gossipiicola]